MLLSEQPWPVIDALSRDTPVVFPVAALEQHGRHMPVYTDSLLMGEVVRRATESMGDRVLFAPLIWLGNSHHHMDFAGSMSADPRTYLDTLCGLYENFLMHGFRRLLIINGHGGNDVPGKQAVFETRQKHRIRKDLLLLFATYWNLAPEAGNSHPDLYQQQMGHACEWETSMILKLRPELVHDHRSVPDVAFGNAFEPAARGWTMPDRSVPGHIGYPNRASAEKGEALFRTFSSALVTLLERMIAWDGRSWEG